MTTLYWIRHSITEANARHLYYGATDLPLNAEGRALCESFAGRYPTGIEYATSGMLRTEETLRLLFGDVPHRIYPEFREMNFGIFEMHCHDELVDWDTYQQFITDTTGRCVIPNGESKQQFFGRVALGVDQMVPSLERDLLIVAHGGVIATAMERLFPTENRNFYEWLPAVCHGYAVQLQAGKALAYRAI